MSKSTSILYLIFILVIFCSCEGGTTFIKTVDNQSSEQIEIQLFLKNGSIENFIVSQKTSKEIFFKDQERNFVDASYQCTNEFDSVKISISNNKVLNKDFLNANNWQQQSTTGNNSQEKCTFIVLDQDIM